MNCPACRAPLETRRFEDGTEVDFCPACHGVWYDLADMSLTVAVAGEGPTERLCPRDGQQLVRGAAAGTIVTADRCPACGGLWLDAGEVQKLRAELKVDSLIGKGASQAPPPLPRPGASTAAPARRVKEAFEGIAADPRDSAYENNSDESLSPRIEHLERSYAHFQTGWPKVGFVLGEFPWRVRVGDEAQTRDFIAPPFLLSEERTGSDRTWTHGVYLEPSEVWAGFGLEGEPPARRSAAPAQPNPHDEAWSVVGLWGSLAAAAALAVFVAAMMFSKRSVVYTGTFTADPAVAEKAVVTPVFTFDGSRPASVRVRLDTNIGNSWAFFRMALVNDETDAALHFERELSYYWGREDGESWSEGSQSDVAYLSRVPPGRYYLVIDPEVPTGGVGYNVQVMWDHPRPDHLAWAWAFLLLPFAWVYLRRRSFEMARWAESDHPMVTSEDDDE
ncbi:MAG: DUF4178 domain-containing protein [Elusimicrobia bacterium]|nr:DUF4178 domain-containing protein [Elusimicrobiota bacterium]